MSQVTPIFSAAFDIVSGVNDVIGVTDSLGNQTITLTAGRYYLLNASDSDCILAEIVTRLDALPAADTYSASVTWDRDPDNDPVSVNITSSNAAFKLWLTATTTFDGADILGWSGETSAAASQDNDQIPKCAWVSPESFQTLDVKRTGNTLQTRAKNGEVYTVERSTRLNDYDCSFTLMPPSRTVYTASVAARRASFEAFLDTTSDGRRVRVFEWNGSGGIAGSNEVGRNTNVGNGFVIDGSTYSNWQPTRFSPGLELYSWGMTLQAQPA